MNVIVEIHSLSLLDDPGLLLPHLHGRLIDGAGKCMLLLCPPFPLAQTTPYIMEQSNAINRAGKHVLLLPRLLRLPFLLLVVGFEKLTGRRDYIHF
jgi:hypothetical protein